MFSASRSGGKSLLPTSENFRHRSASTGLHARDSYGATKRAVSEERKSASGSVGSASKSGGKSLLPTSEAFRHRSTSIGLHARDSYGTAKRSVSEERKSASGSVRRLSGVQNSFGNEPKGIVKDTRPLSDKAYQKRKVTEIAEFLEEQHFSSSISPAKLMQLTKKEFESIFEFLANFLDPSFEVKTLEEDAPKMLKNLAYPFIPNKSVFIHITRANFSSHLGVLIFLMDLAKFALKFDLNKLFINEEHKILLQHIVTFHNSDISDEQQVEAFKNIIRSRYQESLPELINENNIKKEKLEKVQYELKELMTMKEKSELLDSQKQQYEDYLLEMAKHAEKKKTVILNLSAELHQKKSLLADLEEKLEEKQAVYDAQGFDGKKHLFHYEEQKLELNETLQKKKALLREIQEKCWDLDMQHSKVLDTGAELYENFNNMYVQIEEAASTITSSLQSIDDQNIKSLINNFKLNIPDTQMKFNQRTLPAFNNIHKEALEEIQKKISKAHLILKTIMSSKSEDLTEIEMKKSLLSSKLKCASAAEAEKEQEFFKYEKLAIEEVQAIEQKCDEELKALKNVQNENKQLTEHLGKLESDLQELEEIRLSKTAMLEKYLKDQKQLFNQFSSNIKANARKAEECGEEIASFLEELIKRSKEK